ncbi:MAG: hypothetical protein ABGY42_13990 [bacterium]
MAEAAAACGKSKETVTWRLKKKQFPGAKKVGNRWTIPLGGGVGKILRLGGLPMNLQAQAFGNVISPENTPDWSLRFQVQLLFPTG